MSLSSPASPTTRHSPLRWPESRCNSRATARRSPPTAPPMRCSTWRALYHSGTQARPCGRGLAFEVIQRF